MKKILPLFFILILFVRSIVGCKKEATCCDPLPTNTPSLSVSDVTVSEGNSGTTTMNFTLTLNKAASKSLSVNVSTKENYAKAGEDFTAINQTVSFSAGDISKIVTVSVITDDLKEADDDFQLVLADPVNCLLTNNYATGIITNDDTKIPVGDAGYSSPTSYSGMNLVWSEEFNGSQLNTNDWNYDVGDGCPNCGWGNNELEYYTAGDNLYFSSGKMIIEARKEAKGGKNYTSTRLTSLGKLSFKFGRIDVRAKLPKGQGIWPAFWMMGETFPTLGWPTCGEIDIMEFLGQDVTKVYSAIHFKAGTGSRNITKSFSSSSPLPEEFHVFSLVWAQDSFKTLIDDKVIGEFKLSDLAGATYPFNDKFYFLINMAVGGNWPGAPNASTYFPQWYYVDYIRVFQ